MSAAAELVGDAYRQGISDGHGLNRPAGVDDEITEAAALDASRAELLNLLGIIAVRFESPRPIGGPDDAMLIAEIAAALKRARGQS